MIILQKARFQNNTNWIETVQWVGRKNCSPEWQLPASPMCPPCNTGPMPLPFLKLSLIPLSFLIVQIVLVSIPPIQIVFSLYRSHSDGHGFTFLLFHFHQNFHFLLILLDFLFWTDGSMSATKWGFLVGLRGCSTSFPVESSCLSSGCTPIPTRVIWGF